MGGRSGTAGGLWIIGTFTTGAELPCCEPNCDAGAGSEGGKDSRLWLGGGAAGINVWPGRGVERPWFKEGAVLMSFASEDGAAAGFAVSCGCSWAGFRWKNGNA